MASMEELEARVSALEGQMRYVREDAAAARVLAGGADRDVSAFGAKLDAHQRLLEALRETQVEQDRRLAGLEGGQAQILDLLRRRNGREEDPPASAE
jgi:hypothetical protein